MTIRLAVPDDLGKMLEIYAYARARMHASGNAGQWGDDKPSPDTVREDIEKKQAYVILHRGEICGVFAFIIGEDPTYQVIEEGAWLNEEPYGTLHRVAGNGQARGVLSAALSFCGGKIKNIRIDTHDDNKIMRHLLEKYGFIQCGYIYVEDGSRRIAYQKAITFHKE